MPTPTIRVATYNVGHSRSDSAIDADIDRLTRVADVICLQEMSGHHDAITLPRGWWVTHPRKTGESDVPICWDNDKLKMIRRGYRHATDPQPVERAAGGNDVAAKGVAWVLFRHRVTGRRITVMNTHAVASIEHHGQPDDRHPKRLRVFEALMDTTQRMVRRRHNRGQLVILAGDINVCYRADCHHTDPRFPLTKLAAVDMTPSYDYFGTPDVGTHGKRLIDWVAASAVGSRLRAVNQAILHDGYGSDHRPLVVTYQVQR